MKIDSHHHLWQYDPVEYDWIDDSMSVLKTDFLIPELEAQLDQDGIDGSVVVQARQSLEETEWLCQLAETTDKIKGIVGWVDLRSEDLEQELKRLGQFSKLKGFRHVLQGEDDPEFFTQASFIRGLKLLEQYDFSYDLLIFAHQLPQSIEMLSHVPNLRVVIDHIAKPEIKAGTGFDAWRSGMATLADNPKISCKVSGMVTEADWQNWQVEDFTPYLDTVFELFGVERLMFGSDWPVCLVAAKYSEVKSIIENKLASLNDSQTQQIFGGNASAFYRLED